ncbi:hypothetical protein [Tautonia sociabilis]|uniref:Uncharacterized protein n=1 Tax=Tautonia sociabilis TaxID=2080755 RepID=A0A432MNH2_9BACT|nr:hypothetical protein [Tautonia sociabilis]RUL88799.1 hypothetical protein TsocGM_05430 [Tautonia sociabilis]
MTGAECDAIPHENVDPAFVCALVRGILIVNPIPLSSARGPNNLLGFLLRLNQDQHPEGVCLDGTLFKEEVELSPDD